MSRRRQTQTDRRSLIAAAAALAGAGAADASNSPGARRRTTPQFTVDLGGAVLPERLAAELQARIRRDVAAVLARAGIEGELSSERPRADLYALAFRPAGGTRGRTELGTPKSPRNLGRA